MTDKTTDSVLQDETPRVGESFLQRFHRRKTEARLAPAEAEPVALTDDAQALGAADAEPEPEQELTDADMPPLESLDANSDYTGFLSPKVSESLRRAALRKLFRGPQFNVIDELDDYAEDFTTFTALGDIVTSDMRHMIEVEAKKHAEALKQALLDEKQCDSAEPAADSAVEDAAALEAETPAVAEANAEAEADAPIPPAVQ